MPGFQINEQQLKSRTFEGFYSAKDNHYLIYSFKYSENVGSAVPYYFAVSLNSIDIGSAVIIHVPHRSHLGPIYLDPLQDFFTKIQDPEYKLTLSTQGIEVTTLMEEALQHIRNVITQSDAYKELNAYSEAMTAPSKKGAVIGCLNLMKNFPNNDDQNYSIIELFVQTQKFFTIANQMIVIKDMKISEISGNNNFDPILRTMVIPQEKWLGKWQGQAKTAGETTTYNALIPLKTFLEAPRTLPNSELEFKLNEVMLQLSNRFKQLEPQIKIMQSFLQATKQL